MIEPRRYYFDNAATSWPKHPEVVDAMCRFMQQVGAASGRGGYRSASAADAIVQKLRTRIARLIGMDDSSSISFHANGTSALNAAILGTIRAGDHVVTTAAEHNSVLRPLAHLSANHQVDVTVIAVDSNGSVDAEEVIGAIRHNTTLVAVAHASNVTGAVQPIREVGAAVAKHDALFLVDAAQSFGAIDVNLVTSHIDLLAAPGHKSSGGPLGTAFLAVGAKAADRIRPAIHGGTGNRSESLMMPAELPAKLEPGNLNVPALAGWLVAMEQILQIGIEGIQQDCADRAQQLRSVLEALPGIKAKAQGEQLPIAAFIPTGCSSHDLASILDVEFGIEARAGLHCAPLIHQCIFGDKPTERSLQAWQAGGPNVAEVSTIRLSASRSTTDRDFDHLSESLRTILNELQDE